MGKGIAAPGRQAVEVDERTTLVAQVEALTARLPELQLEIASTTAALAAAGQALRAYDAKVVQTEALFIQRGSRMVLTRFLADPGVLAPLAFDALSYRAASGVRLQPEQYWGALPETIGAASQQWLAGSLPQINMRTLQTGGRHRRLGPDRIYVEMREDGSPKRAYLAQGDVMRLDAVLRIVRMGHVFEHEPWDDILAIPQVSEFISHRLPLRTLGEVCHAMRQDALTVSRPNHVYVYGGTEVRVLRTEPESAASVLPAP